MIPRNLSYSQIKSWQECRRQWAYKYRDGYRPKQPKLEFMRGSLLHKGMEYGLAGLPWGNALVDWIAEWNIGGEEMVVEPGWVDGMKTIVDGALDIFHQDWEVLADKDGPLIERRMYIPLPDWYRGIVFIPDVAVRKRRDPYAGGVFGLDFKSFGKPKLEMAGDVDLQAAIYQLGLRQHGHNAMGTCLFQLATEPRKPIRLKKDGDPYAGDQERFDNWSPVTGQILTVRNDDWLNGVWDQVVLPVTKEVYQQETTGSDLTLPPHLSYFGCQYCEFFAPCQARLKGHDEGAILADNYNRRESAKGV